MFPPCDLPGLNYGGCNEDNGDLLQKVACRYCYTQCPQPCSRPPLIHTSAYSWTLMGKSGSVSCGVTASFSWVLVRTRFCFFLPRVCFPVLCKFWQLFGGVNGDLRQEGLCHTQVCCTQSPCGRPLLTCTSTGDTQTQFWLSFCGLGMHFMPFPGLSISGDQVLCDHTVPGGLCVLITSPVLAARFPWCAARVRSQVCRMSPLKNSSQAATLLADVNHPGSQEDAVSSWEPAHSLVENAVSGAEM